MYIIKKEPLMSGAYPNMQTWDLDAPPYGYAIVPDELDIAVFYEYNGFVFLTIENDTVKEMKANIAAWERWKAALPTEEPEAEPSAEDDLLAMAIDH